MTTKRGPGRPRGSDLIMTTVYIPTAMKRRLERLAKKTGKTEAAHQRAALERYLDEQDVIDP